MTEPQYDASDMDNYYLATENRALRAQRDALLAALKTVRGHLTAPFEGNAGVVRQYVKAIVAIHDAITNMEGRHAPDELQKLLQAQDSQPAQAAQPSNHPVFVAGPADAGSHAATLAYVLGQLRHAYHNLIGPEIAWDREHRMRLADGLISPQIMRLEQLAESMASASAPAAPRETKT